ncbi:MAG TPA: YraN family protein [candidate division Zixibacteria bacterium]|nr:YraN family protein [candidate division Zixibacteria bacterium]
MPSSRKGSSKEDRLKIGRQFEDQAAQFYITQQYKILERNYRAGHKEIDLIVQKGNTVVFVEVKSAKSKSLGHPAERVTKKKIKSHLSKSKRRNLILLGTPSKKSRRKNVRTWSKQPSSI